MHSERPSFYKISHLLSTCGQQLLQWSDESDSRGKLLGTPLNEAESLFKDLQDVYMRPK